MESLRQSKSTLQKLLYQLSICLRKSLYGYKFSLARDRCIKDSFHLPILPRLLLSISSLLGCLLILISTSWSSIVQDNNHNYLTTATRTNFYVYFQLTSFSWWGLTYLSICPPSPPPLLAHLNTSFPKWGKMVSQPICATVTEYLWLNIYKEQRVIPYHSGGWEAPVQGLQLLRTVLLCHPTTGQARCGPAHSFIKNPLPLSR